jgi:hypothetical protein
MQINYYRYYSFMELQENCVRFPPLHSAVPRGRSFATSAFNLAKLRAMGIPNAARSATYKHRGVKQRHDLQGIGRLATVAVGPKYTTTGRP